MYKMLFSEDAGGPVAMLPFDEDGNVRAPDGIKFFNIDQSTRKWPALHRAYFAALWKNGPGLFIAADDVTEEVASSGDEQVEVAAVPTSTGEAAPIKPIQVLSQRLISSMDERTFEVLRRRWAEFDDFEFAQILAQYRQCNLDPVRGLIIPKKQPDPDTGKESLVFIVKADVFLIAAHASGDFKGFDAPEFAGRDGVWKEHWPEDQQPYKARCRVRRGDSEFCWPIYWRDVAQYFVPTSGDDRTPRLTHWWRERWTNQFGKCSLVASLRKAYADRLNRMFLNEEIASPGSRGSASRSDDEPTRPERDSYSQVASYEDNYSQV